jgi:hypothetical protein
MAGAQCDGAAFGGSGGLGPGTANMSFVDVLTCRQSHGPPVPVVGAHVLQNDFLMAAVMYKTGIQTGMVGGERPRPQHAVSQPMGSAILYALPYRWMRHYTPFRIGGRDTAGISCRREGWRER